MVKRSILFVLFISYCLSICIGQTFEIGERYFSANEHTEYIHGNLPIILSAPHGGEKQPNNIPDRDCPSCVTQNDSYTQELTRELAEAIIEKTGCFPHVIINRLHRSKLDANRNQTEGADGDPQGIIAWMGYHDFVDSARQFVEESFGKGLFLDIHGHGHDIQRLELGYLLSKSNLQLSDDELADVEFINKSSIRSLANTNLQNEEFSSLIRGDNSFGTLIGNRNFDAVPSAQDENPIGNELYFSGGYNTVQYGSRNNGNIDAIQIECNQDVRFNATTRKRFADSLATVIIEFIEYYYFDQSLSNICSSTSVKELKDISFEIYPNPATDFILIRGLKQPSQIRIYDQLGRLLINQFVDEFNNQIKVTSLQVGIYFIRIETRDGWFDRKHLIIN